MTHPWFQGIGPPRVLAHRGLVTAGSTDVAENSFAAVAAAHAAGAAYVESDCHLTADGVPVLFHDADLGRVLGDARSVAEIDAAQLAELMVDRGGLITLQQALESFPDLRFNIDVKADAAAEPVGRLVAVHAERVLVTSFSDRRRRRAVRAAENIGAGIRPATSAGTLTVALVLAAVWTRSRRLVARALGGVDALQVPERHRGVRIVGQRLVEAVHAHGVEVHVWTVNEPQDMLRLVAMGVDGLVTDRADVALQLLAGRT